MLPLNRIYTPEELRAMCRLSPVAPGTVGPHRNGASAGRSRGAFLGVLQRLVSRGGLRRPAPGTA
jgi:hypothetical protein